MAPGCVVVDAHDDGDDGLYHVGTRSTAPAPKPLTSSCGGGIDVCAPHLRSDLWERMRILGFTVKHTLLTATTRGQIPLMFEFFPDDIPLPIVERILADGIRSHHARMTRSTTCAT